MPRKKDKPKVRPKRIHGINGDNLTIKQQKFVKNLAITGNATKAVKQSYDAKTDQTAGAIGSKLLKKDKIQKALAEELDKVGLTEARTAELLEEAIVSGVGRDSRNSDALRGLDMLLKVRGSYAPKQIEKKELSLSLQGKEDTDLKEAMAEQLAVLKKLVGEEE